MAVRAAIGNTLTGSTGLTKWAKDFVADALISAAAALTAAGIGAIPTDTTQAQVAGFAIAGAILHAAYRIVLKWATS